MFGVLDICVTGIAGTVKFEVQTSQKILKTKKRKLKPIVGYSNRDVSKMHKVSVIDAA